MSDKIFLDTNILVYLFSKDEPYKKGNAIKAIAQSSCITGINNINELANVLIKKFNVSYTDVVRCIDQVSQSIEVVNINIEIIKQAIIIHERYHYSYFDSLVISTAIENQCAFLYSEDMQHNHLINDTLTIKDIFKA